jgi:hypothetical protein
MEEYVVNPDTYNHLVKMVGLNKVNVALAHCEMYGSDMAFDICMDKMMFDEAFCIHELFFVSHSGK